MTEREKSKVQVGTSRLARAHRYTHRRWFEVSDSFSRRSAVGRISAKIFSQNFLLQNFGFDVDFSSFPQTGRWHPSKEIAKPSTVGFRRRDLPFRICGATKAKRRG
jgi:hypothetical protein